MAGHPCIVLSAQRVTFVEIECAVKQVDHSIDAEIECSHLLPEPLGCCLIGTNELGIDQLLNHQDHKSLFLVGNARS
ncbi:hypothetical protein [Synechococcus sp. CS-603]|uniref:hypothetical protein n=1 Tax=Synechococcus sp. CS-603 TaxID=2847981 RepID=UPI00223BEC7D|nr:hypothetical protein [Synechococcus sp. CS-603]